jgi:aspartate/methionine/tyrosine aminotransferase
MRKGQKLSEAAYRIEGQPMFKVLDNVQELEQLGEDIVHFEIGDPDFDTPGHIIEAAYASMKNGETHYTSSMGLHGMRVAASEATAFSRKFTPSLEQVLVTPGANIIIYLAVKCLVNPGEEVIFPDPGFPTYYSAIRLCGGAPVRVPLREENAFRMNPRDIERAVTKKTRLIIINSPSNPTGSVMTPAEIDEVYRIAESRGIYLLSDEIYSRMIYGDIPFHSPSFNDRCEHTTIVANGFSKAFAMTGWRLGVAIGPEEIIKKMGLLVQTLCSCVPPFVQRAGISALKGDQAEIRRMMEIYKERRDLLVEGLNRIRGMRCLMNEGAFYVFPNVQETGMTSEEFADFMLDKGKVALLPGTNFGEFGQGYVRLTYATGIERIKEGLARMEKALNLNYPRTNSG